jgi:hypothetical protein
MAGNVMKGDVVLDDNDKSPSNCCINIRDDANDNESGKRSMKNSKVSYQNFSQRLLLLLLFRSAEAADPLCMMG